VPTARGGVAVIVAMTVTLTASSAAAQGKSNPPGHSGTHPHPAEPLSSGPAASSSRVMYLGSWLDDATLLGTGNIAMSISAAFWASPGTHQLDLPIVAAIVGARRRFDVGIGAPVSRVTDGSGAQISGVGQVFVYGKLALTNPASAGRHVGLAFSPVVQITSGTWDPTGTSQVGIALPLNLELRGGPCRVYGSVGYFSRGATFATGALEVATSRSLVLTGTLGYTASTAAAVSALDVSPSRTDTSFAATVRVSPRAALAASVGRSRATAGDASAAVTSYWVSGGVTFLLARR
jgi:hypothetical protein